MLRFICCFVIMLSVFSWWCAAGADSSPPKNVLFIMSDDLNTALSGYGHPECQTPHLDMLAETGVSFTRAYSQWPICGPSRASIMTGQYPEKNGVRRNKQKFRADLVTLPRLFRNSGYWVGRVGKIYHLGVPGEAMGGVSPSDHAPSWDYVYDIHAMETLTPGKAEDLMEPDSTSLYPELREKWKSMEPGQEKGLFSIPGNSQGSDAVVVETADDPTLLADGMSTNRAIEILRERAADEKPFFLGVGFLRPHAPYVAPERDFASYDYREISVPEVPADDAADIPRQSLGKDLQPDPVKRQKIRRGYYASVTYMDRMVGRLLAALDELGLRENTIIVFVSDHGYLLGEHNQWRKNQLWEEAIRVPLIISAPELKIRGESCPQIVELIDLYPTVAELAGLTPDPGIQGLSLVSLLNDPASAHTRSDAYIQVPAGHGLRAGKWAYMWYPENKKLPEGFMLYDMEQDPAQWTNLAESIEHRVVREALHQRLQERIQAAGE